MDAKWAITTIVAVVLSVGTSCYTLTRSLGTVEGKVDGIEKRFTDLGRQVDRIDDANVKLDDYVRRLEVSVGGLERDVKRFEAGVNAFGGFEGGFSTFKLSIKQSKDLSRDSGAMLQLPSMKM